MSTRAVAILSTKRRALTRRDWTRDWRRSRGKRRVWIGTRAKAGPRRPLFLALSAQHMKRSRLADWLGAAAMVLGAASWGVLAAMLAA